MPQTLRTYTHLQNEIVGQMFKYMTSASLFKVKKLPDNEADFTKAFNGCLISVAFKEAAFEKPANMGMNSQEEIVTLEIILESKSLYKQNGIHYTKYLIDRSLAGFTPTHYIKMWAKHIYYVGTLEGTHQYSYIWQTKGYLVPYEEENEILIPGEQDIILEKIIFEDLDQVKQGQVPFNSNS